MTIHSASPGHLAVVAATYQFFTGKIPEADGFEFLIDSPDNPNDINDAYYTQFNAENLFINFANNQAAVSPTFADQFGALSFEQAVAAAYDKIVGFSAAEAAGIDVAKALGFFMEAKGYYESIALERVVPGVVPLDEAVKIVMIGSMLNEAYKSGVGTYGYALDTFIADVKDDDFSATFGRDMIEDVNHAPFTITEDLVVSIAEGSEVTLDLRTIFADPDGTNLLYGIVDGPEFTSVNSYELTISPDYTQAGSHSLTVWASDGPTSTEATLTFLVRDRAESMIEVPVEVPTYPDHVLIYDADASAPITSTKNFDGTEMPFGDGNLVDGFNTLRINDIGVTIGIKGVERQGPDLPGTSEGLGIMRYEGDAGVQIDHGGNAGRSAVSQNYFIDTGNVPIEDATVTFHRFLDRDPTDGVDQVHLVLDPMGPGIAVWRDAITGDVTNTDDDGTLNIGSSSNSENLAFGYWMNDRDVPAGVYTNVLEVREADGVTVIGSVTSILDLSDVA